MAPKSKLTFEQSYVCTQTGEAEWDIRVDGTVIGNIHKDTKWCGDGYRADSYSVQTFDTDKDGLYESFDVANIWSRGKGMTARQALKACKDLVRKALKEGKL